MTDEPAPGVPEVADCVFCGIVAGIVPSTVVRETPSVLAFRDVTPRAPTHILVIPKRHYPNAGELGAKDAALAGAVLAEAAAVAADEGVAETGYRIVFNTGPGAGQSVFHVHAHVLAGRPFAWPPG